MNKILLAAFSLFAVASIASAQQRKGRVIAVGFYNVENFFHPTNDTAKKDEDFTPEGTYHYTFEVYRQKLDNMAKVISELATDVTPDGAAIVGIAEIENDSVLTDLINHPMLKPRNYQFVWFPTPDVRGISTALLYNPKYFTFLNARPYRVPLETVGQPRPTRNVLYVTGLLPGGDTVHVTVNHWPSRSGGVAETNPFRELAASINKKIADSLMAINPGAKMMIMGDLNDNPVDPSIKKVLKAQGDTSKVGLSGIYNPWLKLFKRDIGTEIFDGQWNLLDQIMLTGGFLKNPNGKWAYLTNRIFRKDYLINQAAGENGHPHRSFTIDRVWDNGYSDHLPVIVYLIQ